jgi:hypothetical protein
MLAEASSAVLDATHSAGQHAVSPKTLPVGTVAAESLRGRFRHDQRIGLGNGK